jgi:hypothetical protein
VGLAFLWLERSLSHGFNIPQAAEVTVRREKALDFGGGQNGKWPVLTLGWHHGRVVANQNRTVPIEVRITKGISRGRPTIPANSPNAGIQMAPMVVIRCIAGSDAEAGQPILHANSSPTSHRPKLKTGAANPTRLARARQSE